MAFQHLKKVKKITYQCSISSTGLELAAVYKDAYTKQEHLETQQKEKHACLLGIDETGLIPENRQALKSLHDFLDERKVGTVMMSNLTLDAAKTSRTIQLLQTQVAKKYFISQFKRMINISYLIRLFSVSFRFFSSCLS